GGRPPRPWERATLAEPAEGVKAAALDRARARCYRPRSLEEPPLAGAPRPRDPLLFLALALALGALGSTLADMRHAGGLDFYQFWVVAQVAGRPDVADIYDYDTRARLGAEYIRRAEADEESERRRVIAPHWPVLEPTATPLSYAASRPLALCGFERALLAFALAGLAAAAAGLLLLARLL